MEIVVLTLAEISKISQTTKVLFFKKIRLSFHDFFYILNCWRMLVAGNITVSDLEFSNSAVSRWYIEK